MCVEKLHVEQHSLFGFVISICIFTTLFNYLYTFFCYKHVNLLRMNDTRNVQVLTDSFGVITEKGKPMDNPEYIYHRTCINTRRKRKLILVLSERERGAQIWFITCDLELGFFS